MWSRFASLAPFSRTPCQALQRLLLDPCGYARTTAGKVPILNLRAIVGIHVGAVQTPADYFSGIEFGAATPATWLCRVRPVSRKLDLDHIRVTPPASAVPAGTRALGIPEVRHGIRCGRYRSSGDRRCKRNPPHSGSNAPPRHTSVDVRISRAHFR